MTQPLFTRLGLSSSTGNSSEVSQPVTMQGGNAVQVDSVLYALTATNVSYQLQSSNDLENWANQGSAETHTVVGYKMLTAITAISAAYVRLKATLTGSGVAVVSADISVSAQ